MSDTLDVGGPNDRTSPGRSPVLEPVDDVITCLDHVAIAVNDVEDSIRWYRDALGFSLIERRTTRGLSTGMTSAVMQAGGAVVVLVQGLEPASQVSRFVAEFGEGVQHVAFSVTDMDAAIERLTAAGAVAETGVLEDVGIRQTFLRREAGSPVRVELIERRGGSFSDRSVERLFRSMEERDIF
jgi:methylmalonyl-CoA/ethylmalonyl-CoA epimerase